MLVLVGALHFVDGVSTLAGAQLDVLAQQPGGMTDTAWGLLCMAVGGLEALTGYGVLRGASWARVAAVVIAVSGLVLSAAYAGLPAYAVVVLITVAVVLAYAVIAHGAEVRPIE